MREILEQSASALRIATGVSLAHRSPHNAALAYVNGNGGIMSEQCSIVLERQS